MTILRNLFKSKKVCRIIITVIIIYTIVYFIEQQKKLDKYKTEQAYYNSQIEELQAEQEELKKEQANMDSPEYIEEQARDKIDMYYPNERVYIAQ